jgi:hypothetical protein
MKAYNIHKYKLKKISKININNIKFLYIYLILTSKQYFIFTLTIFLQSEI